VYVQVALTRFQRFLELPEGGALLLGDRGSEVGLRIKGDFAWEGGQGDTATLRGLDIKVRQGRAEDTALRQSRVCSSSRIVWHEREDVGVLCGR
jgi:hypothetical protein